MNRLPDEDYLSYSKRLIEAKKNGLISYQELADGLLLDENVYSDDNIRKFYYIYEKMIKYLGNIETSDADEQIRAYEKIKEDIIKERKKLQTVNLEYNATKTIEARMELLHEFIGDSIARLKPIKIVPTTHKSEPESTVGLLIVSDAHYGKTFEIKGLFGETVNEYSPEIFKARMWKLLSDLENDTAIMNLDKLIVCDCGDAVEGVLRSTGTLQKLKVGVTDSAMEYGEFMAVWLAEVYNRLGIPVEYSLTGGNHDLLRLLSSKKDFDEENIAKIILKEISLRIKISSLEAELKYGIKPEILINEYTDVSYQNVFGINILAYHGESKDLKDDIEFFENFYNIDVDILITGHLHRSSQETIGIGYMGDREIIRVPSLIGMDDFSKKIRKLSRAGSRFMTFTENGKQWEKTFFLN